MWNMDTTDETINRPSITSDMTFAVDSTTPTECKDAIIESLRNQIRAFESENAALKRSMPRLAQLRDYSGKDVTAKMADLSQRLTQKEYQLENANSMCARKHEELERVRTEMFNQLHLTEQKVYDATQRAKAYEEENRELREQLENEQSRLFRINQHQENSGTTDTETLCADHPNDMETIERLQQDLNDRLAELESVRKESRDWQVKFEQRSAEFTDLKRSNEQFHKFVDKILSGQEIRKSFLEKSLTEAHSDADYVVANMLALLDLLDSNGREMKTLRHEIIETLCRNGYETNEANVNILSQSLRNDLSNFCEQIKRQSSLQPQDAIGKAQDNEFSEASIVLSFSEMAKNSANVSVFNRTLEISQDVGNAHQQMEALRKVCTQLFEKLRGTAEFLEQILETLGETDDGRSILDKIQQLRFDINQSMHEATLAACEFEKAEKSMMNFCEMISQMFDASLLNEENSTAEILINEQLELVRRENVQLTDELKQLKEDKVEVLNKLECLQKEHDVEFHKLQERYKEEIEELNQTAQKVFDLEKIQEENEKEIEALRSTVDDANEKIKITEEQLEHERNEMERLTKTLQDAETRRLQMLAQVESEKAAMEVENMCRKDEIELLKLREDNANVIVQLNNAKDTLQFELHAKDEIIEKLRLQKMKNDDLKKKIDLLHEENVAQLAKLKEQYDSELLELRRKYEKIENKENKPGMAGIGKQITNELGKIYESMAKASGSAGGTYRKSKNKQTSSNQPL